MKALVSAGFLLVLASSAFSQGVITFQGGPADSINTVPGRIIIDPGFGSGGSSYVTGGGSLSPGIGGTAGNVREHTFGGSGYFTSSGEVIDPGLALRLGNGVKPNAASGNGLLVVPEAAPSVLFGLGAALWLCRRAIARAIGRSPS